MVDPDPAADDARLMRLALELAETAVEHDDVPIGAVLARDGEVIAEAVNERELRGDPTAHAEILALRAGAGVVDDGWRLLDTTLYVTLEPCAMCAGAISHARIGRVVYGARDEKGGAVESGVRFFGQPTCHSKPEVTGGVMAEEAGILLKDFFKARR